MESTVSPPAPPHVVHVESSGLRASVTAAGEATSPGPTDPTCHPSFPSPLTPPTKGHSSLRKALETLRGPGPFTLKELREHVNARVDEVCSDGEGGAQCDRARSEDAIRQCLQEMGAQCRRALPHRQGSEAYTLPTAPAKVALLVCPHDVVHNERIVLDRDCVPGAAEKGGAWSLAEEVASLHSEGYVVARCKGDAPGEVRAAVMDACPQLQSGRCAPVHALLLYSGWVRDQDGEVALLPTTHPAVGSAPAVDGDGQCKKTPLFLAYVCV